MASGRWTSTEDEKLREFISQGKEKLMEELQPRTWRAIKHRVDRLGLTLPNSFSRYSKEEDKILIENSSKPKDVLMKLLPGRKWDSIAYRIEYLGLEREKKWTLWTEEEIRLLESSKTMDEAMSKLPNRSRDMIASQAQKRGVKFEGVQWTEEEDRILKENYSKISASEVANILGRSVVSIYVRANRKGYISHFRTHKITQDEAIQMYCDHKMTILEIAEQVKMSPAKIRKLIPDELMRNIAELNLEDIAEMYENGKGSTTIAKKYEVYPSTIVKFLRRNGIEIRSIDYYFEHYKLDIPIREITSLYKYGFSSVEIGEIYNANGTTIIQRLRLNNVEIREDNSFYISGEKAHNWSGGKSDPGRASKHYFRWRNAVYERDSYTCQCCGDSSGGNLNAHHIYNYSEHEELRYDISNGITMCELCHMPNCYGSFHRIYGTKNNDIYQLQEYFDDIRASIGLPLVSIESIVESN